MKKLLFSIAIYNTFSEKKEPLPRGGGKPLRMFVCGPTVYDTPHIGNARTFVFFDIFARFLRSQGVNVFYLQNITDVDDKIIQRAKERGVNWKKIAREYEKVFSKNLQALRVASVTTFARATRRIPEIVKQVKTLIRKKHAYLIPDDGYYFDLSTFPEYGKLAHRTVEQAEDGVTRIDASDKKRNRGDFCLWKFSKRGEPQWKTELGAGRPGWHIEDTAITEHFFGTQYEIHGGGMDLKFPHHEAEIAQQEAASGKKPFVKIWMHSGFLTVRGERMGKSKGNFVTVDDMLARHSADAFRMAIFMHHYRSSLNYTDAAMEQAKKNLRDIALFVERLRFAGKKKQNAAARAARYRSAIADFRTMRRDFLASLADDVNSPRALAALFAYLNKAQPRIWNIVGRDAALIANGVQALFETLGFSLKSPKIPKEIKALVKKRELFKRSRQFMQSDALRKKIAELGYVVEDTPQGPFVTVA